MRKHETLCVWGVCQMSSSGRECIKQRRWSFDLFHLGQYVLVLDDVFIGGQQDIELPAAQLRHETAAQGRGALSCGGHTHKKKITFCLTILQ